MSYPEYIISDLVQYEQPKKYLVNSTKYDKSYKTPVLTPGKTFILGYTNEETGIYKASSNPVIIFDDFTCDYKWVDFDFKLKSSACKLLTVKDSNLVNLRFFYYLLSKYGSTNSKEHTRKWISEISTKKISLPPMNVQLKIVKFLNSLTELETELETRKKQFSYYLSVLTTESVLRKLLINYQTLSLSQLFEIQHGTVVNTKKLEKGEIPVVSGGLKPFYFVNKSNIKNCVTVASSGCYAGYVQFWNREIFACDCLTMFNNDLNLTKFLYYILKAKQNLLYSFQKGAGIPHVYQRDLINLEYIKITDTKKLESIIFILDELNAISNSFVLGIPSEINLRKKQYKYYLEKLLNFE